MVHESEALLYLELGPNDYANAFIWQFCIVTARHVAGELRRVSVPGKSESANVSFRVLERDLAISHDRTLEGGYENVAVARLGEAVRVLGHHGPKREAFEIIAKVIEMLPDQRIVIERKSGKTFQAGMSGSPVINEKGEVIGILVRGAPGEDDGQKVILEPAIALVA
jgi:hypothetical protein